MTAPDVAWALRVSDLDADAQVFLYAVLLSMRDGREDRPAIDGAATAPDVASLEEWLVETGYMSRARDEMDAVSA